MNYLKGKVRSFLSWYQKDVNHMFSSVNIETYGYCNRKCKFCFNHDSFHDRVKGIMDDDLFCNIIDQLACIKFAGRISPILYGEPLLDKRIVSFIQYIKDKVPFAEIWINSNGDFLTEKLLTKLLESGLDKMYVTNYDDNENDNLNYLANQYSSTVVYKKILDKRIVNRAGALFEGESAVKEMPCLQPTGQLVINWNGDVLLCCNDYYAKYCFGNLKEISVLDAWNNAQFKKYRKILRKEGGRAKIDLCRNCDM